MIIVSCDPGQTGGIVIFKNDDLLSAFPVYLEDGEIDSVKVFEEVSRSVSKYDNIKGCIELVHAMPRQGVSSTYKFGYTTGKLTAALELACRVSIKKLRPQDWKKHWGLKGTTKEDAVNLALKMCPTLFDGYKEKNGKLPNKQLQSGIADAYLIGRYYYCKLLAPDS